MDSILAQVIPKRMVDTYCYIHATYTVDSEPSKDLADGALYSMQGLFSLEVLLGTSVFRTWRGDPDFTHNLP